MRLGVMVAALVLLVSVGYADRGHTRSVTSRASSDSWWCSHERMRCTGFDAAAYHARWEWREKGYAAGGGALGFAILAAGRTRLRLRL
jgi:hypothetical protein